MLVNAIQSDKENQKQLAELQRIEAEVETAEKLHKVGVISRNEYEQTVARYEKAKASTQESDSITKLKEELIGAMNIRIRLIEKRPAPMRRPMVGTRSLRNR